jgi:hypothetical protein
MDNSGSVQVSNARIQEILQGKSMGLLNQALQECAQLTAVNEALTKKVGELHMELAKRDAIASQPSPPQNTGSVEG